MRFGERIKYNLKNFGLLTAIRLVVLPKLVSLLGGNWSNYSRNALLKWQKKAVKSVLREYENRNFPTGTLEEDYTIWTCWWQGTEDMPEVIRECHKSLLRNSGGHRVVLLTKDNWCKYINLPEWLVQKMKTGKISLSHFSDIIRVALLKKYGGMWIDAATFVIRPINSTSNFYMPRLATANDSLNQGKWVFSIMKGASGHPVFSYMYDCLVHYWKNHDAVIDYLMFDGFLYLGYDSIPSIRKEIDHLAISSPDFHLPRYTFSKKLDKQLFERLMLNNDVLSLTWRVDYPHATNDGAMTFYGELIKQFSTPTTFPQSNNF